MVCISVAFSSFSQLLLPWKESQTLQQELHVTWLSGTYIVTRNKTIQQALISSSLSLSFCLESEELLWAKINYEYVRNEMNCCDQEQDIDVAIKHTKILFPCWYGAKLFNIHHLFMNGPPNLCFKSQYVKHAFINALYEVEGTCIVMLWACIINWVLEKSAFDGIACFCYECLAIYGIQV